MTRQKQWMSRALELAEKASCEGEVPVGAVIVHDDQIIGEGWNQPIACNDATAHAEILAIRDAGKRLGNYRLNGCALYVTLEPCVMCAGAIVHARLDNVIFGARDVKAGAAGSIINLLESPLLNHRCTVTSGLLENECKAILKGFFEIKRTSSLSI